MTRRRRIKKESIHYVDNEKFTEAVTAYASHTRDVIAENEKNKKAREESGSNMGHNNPPEDVDYIELPQMSNYIGSCILKIGQRLATAPNFVNYSYREEMISDGVENVFLYLKNFDPTGQELVKVFINILEGDKRTTAQTISKHFPEIIKKIKNRDEFYVSIVHPIFMPGEAGSKTFSLATRLQNITEEEIEFFFDKAVTVMGKPKYDLKKVNMKKKPNAFAYVTQIIHFAFLRRIEKEKKQQYVKQKSIETAGIFSEISSLQSHDVGSTYVNELLDKMQNNMEYSYEPKTAAKKTPKKRGRKKGSKVNKKSGTNTLEDLIK